MWLEMVTGKFTGKQYSPAPKLVISYSKLPPSLLTMVHNYTQLNLLFFSRLKGEEILIPLPTYNFVTTFFQNLHS